MPPRITALASAAMATLMAASFVLAAAPALAATSPWTWSHDAGVPSLAAGSQTDGSSVTSLRCRPRSGELEVIFWIASDPAARKDAHGYWVDAKTGRPAPWFVTARATSGGAVLDDPKGEVDDESLSHNFEVQLTVPTASPVAQAFARTGAVSFSLYGQSTNDPPAPMPLVARLMKVCSKR